jgi:nickel transport protein
MVLLTTLLTAANQALALTNEQVAERLRSVPVFAITTADGVPLVNQVSEDGETIAVTDLYISWRDAEAFIEELQAANPELAEQVAVRPLSLADVFNVIVNESDQPNVPRFSIIPMQAEVTAAQTIVAEQGGSTEEFSGVPLYYAEATGNEGGYLTITQGEQRVIPLYFEQEGIDGLLSRVSQENPGLANSMEVQVTTLESVIGVLLNSENDPELNNIFLVPMVDSLEYIQQNQGGAPPAAPVAPAE